MLCKVANVVDSFLLVTTLASMAALWLWIMFALTLLMHDIYLVVSFLCTCDSIFRILLATLFLSMRQILLNVCLRRLHTLFNAVIRVLRRSHRGTLALILLQILSMILLFPERSVRLYILSLFELAILLSMIPFDFNAIN